jgi:hypothetical protein
MSVIEDENPNVRKLVTDKLRQSGFDGLVNPHIDCGCLLDDLMPCEEPELSHCVGGYKHPAPDDTDYLYVMKTTSYPLTDKKE